MSNNWRRQFHTEESCKRAKEATRTANRALQRSCSQGWNVPRSCCEPQLRRGSTSTMCSQPTENTRFHICVFPWLIRIPSWSHKAVSTCLCRVAKRSGVATMKMSSKKANNFSLGNSPWLLLGNRTKLHERITCSPPSPCTMSWTPPSSSSQMQLEGWP